MSFLWVLKTSLLRWWKGWKYGRYFEFFFSSWALTVERLQLWPWPCFSLGFHYRRIIFTTKEVWVGPYLYFSALQALRNISNAFVVHCEPSKTCSLHAASLTEAPSRQKKHWQKQPGLIQWPWLLQFHTCTVLSTLVEDLSRRGGGGGGMPYMGYIGMCRWRVWFQAVYSGIGCINQRV